MMYQSKAGFLEGSEPVLERPSESSKLPRTSASIDQQPIVILNPAQSSFRGGA